MYQVKLLTFAKRWTISCMSVDYQSKGLKWLLNQLIFF